MDERRCKIFLSLAMIVLLLVPPVGAAAEEGNGSDPAGNLVQRGSRGEFQPAVRYEPGAAADQKSDASVELPTTFTYYYEPNPLKREDPSPEQNTKSIVEEKSAQKAVLEVRKDVSELSEADRQVREQYLDDLFLKAFRDDASEKGGATLPATDPVSFISDYLKDPENAKMLIDYATARLDLLSGQGQVSDELKTHIGELIVGSSDNDLGIKPLAVDALREALERRIEEFHDPYYDKVFVGGETTGRIGPIDSELADQSEPARSIPVADARGDVPVVPAPHGWRYWDHLLEQTRQNLGEQALARPFNHAKEVSEDDSARAVLPVDATAERTAANQYRAVDSVYVGKDFIKVQEMTSAPKELHPYLKWVLYQRNINPEDLPKYIKTRERLLDLYRRAKEGQGMIRYKGKVYKEFMPDIFEGSGNYELVQMIK